MKTYKLLVTDKFKKSFKKLDRHDAKIIEGWIDKNLSECDDPKWKGKNLKGNLNGYWRYRIGDYRLIVKIEENNLLLIAINIGHRKEIYKRQ